MASDLVMTEDYGRTHMGLHIGFSYGPATFDYMEKPGERIRTWRLAKGMTQAALATAVHLDQSSISDIEKRDAAFSAEVLMRICKALDASPSMVMLGHDASSWPFPRVDIERFLALAPEDRAYVEGKLDAAIATFEPEPTKEDLLRFEKGKANRTQQKVKQTQKGRRA